MSDKNEVSPYLNVSEPTDYVGMETCRSCHQDIYDTFIQTGMGQSFDHATPQKSAAAYGEHTVVYDSIGNYYYKPYWRNRDSLFIKEFRLADGDTIHQRDQYVKYIVGSGQHTNSHIYDENGYLYQAPITFYTQKGFWALAPGFEGGFSSRFNRIIGLECMSCHNSYPTFIEGSENKYLHVPKGIACERCHGPGALHVKEKLAGIVVDTATQIDYTIVNPRHLSRDLQVDVCQRCHLQGVAILKDKKTFEDFKPSTHLKEVMDVYLPEYDGHQTQFIMASQAHRMQKSVCFQKSEMTCISCHNPHISVKQTPRSTFNQKCINCHLPTDPEHLDCALGEQKRIQENNNDCSGCHMPLSGSIDIPHVTITDHFIRKPIPEAEKDQIEQFIGLSCVNNAQPEPLSVAKAYLHYYESYVPSEHHLLDTVAAYLALVKTKNPLKILAPTIHFHYLKNNYAEIRAIAKKTNAALIKEGWTAYRIGEAYWQDENWAMAEQYFQLALQITPLNLDFSNKLGITLMEQGDLERAIEIFEDVLEENPQQASTLTNLGFCYLNLGELKKAQQLYQQALALDPDYEGALLNLAGWHLMRQERKEAKGLLERVLVKHPTHGQAKQLLRELKRGN